MTKKIFETLTQMSHLYSAKLAIKDGSNEYSYSELIGSIEDWSKDLKSINAEKATLVGICLPNSAEYVFIYFSLLKLGYTPLLIDVNFSEKEINYLNEVGISYFISHDNKFDSFSTDAYKRISKLEKKLSLYHCDTPCSDDYQLASSTTVCRLTSGSTGLPKVLEFSETAVMAAASNWVKGTKLSENDNILSLSALSNGLTFNTSLLACFIAGASLHFHQGLLIPNNILSYIDENNITRLVAFPTFYRLLEKSNISSPDVLQRVEYFISSGSKLPDDVSNSLYDQYNLIIHDYYGIAEAGPVTFNNDTVVGLGKALPECDLKMLDLNSKTEKRKEILVKTASMATKYYNHPGEFESRITDEGFFRTGDFGYLDDEFHLFITGRTKDKMIIGGRNIDAQEIVSTVKELRSVRDAVIYEEESSIGESFLHMLVECPNTVQKSDIINHLRTRLASFKIPAKLTLLEQLKRNGAGKIIKI